MDRAALLTERHQTRTGLQGNDPIFGGYPSGLPLDFKLMPEYLNDLGYESLMIGKWHFGYFQ